MPLLGKSDTIEIETCPICLDGFNKDTLVYRPLLKDPSTGLINRGKPYHEDCLNKWCANSDNSLESCTDPATRILFNILNSKIECDYSGPHTIKVWAEDEIIVLGTEPCDRFYDIKKFMASKYKIPIETITLWKMHKDNNDRTLARDSEFIKDSLNLQLLTITPRSEAARPSRDDGDSPEKIAKEVKKIELLQRTEQLSSDQITDAAKREVDVEEVEEEEVEDEDEDKLDRKIQAAKERIEELERMLALRHNDQVQDELQANKAVLTRLLFDRIPILYKEVKDSIVPFLSGTRDFSKSTLRALNKFVEFIFLLLKMGVSAITLIAKLGWPVVKLIPSILYYLGYYGVYAPVSGIYNLYNSDEPRHDSSSSWFGSSDRASSGGGSSWWGSSGNDGNDSNDNSSWFGSSSDGGASSSSSGWFGSSSSDSGASSSSNGWFGSSGGSSSSKDDSSWFGSSSDGGASSSSSGWFGSSSGGPPPYQPEQEGICKPSKTQQRRYGGYVDCPSGSEQGRYCLPMTLAERDCNRPWAQLKIDDPYNGDEPVRSKKRDGFFGGVFGFKHSKRMRRHRKMRK